MTSIADTVVGTLEGRGVSFSIDDGDLIIDAPPKAITDSWANTLRQHKAEILDLVAARDWKPWWDKSLSAVENMAVDDFMRIGDDGPVEDGDWDQGLIDTFPCPTCGHLLAWWDMLGGQHCIRCESPLKSSLLSRKAERLKRRAERQPETPSDPQPEAVPADRLIATGNVSE